ncbi:uncharacterized protein LOC110103228 [Dendrobium catenatum]|uniref:uncharacterized protein LOC110103228 n=1 Tax=Dendrobium catenatum TaxID=906689 RepID=UPI0009F4F542|nr:uncharacterized protein LOC110103228 [Dendrobium catenatum]
MSRLAASLIILFILVFVSFSSGHVESTKSKGGVEDIYQVNKVHGRKFLLVMNDYDYGKANPRHDPPPKGKPGPGGKSP